MIKQLWVVGQNTPDGDWDFQGVFSSEEKAVAACKNSDYWIGPAILDEDLPAESRDWEGSYFPIPDDPIELETRHSWRQGSESPICGDVTARRPSDYEFRYSNSTGPICKACQAIMDARTVIYVGTENQTRQGVARAEDETL